LEVLNTRRNLATVDFRRGNKEAAIDELSSVVLAVRMSKRGPRSLDVATALNDLGYLQKEAGNFQSAIDAYEEAFSIRKDALGPDNPSTVTTEWNLAAVHGAMGNVEKQQSMSASILERFGYSAEDLVEEPK